MTWTLIKEKNKTEIQEQEDFECLDLDEDIIIMKNNKNNEGCINHRNLVQE